MALPRLSEIRLIMPSEISQVLHGVAMPSEIRLIMPSEISQIMA